MIVTRALWTLKVLCVSACSWKLGGRCQPTLDHTIGRLSIWKEDNHRKEKGCVACISIHKQNESTGNCRGGRFWKALWAGLVNGKALFGARCYLSPVCQVPLIISGFRVLSFIFSSIRAFWDSLTTEAHFPCNILSSLTAFSPAVGSFRNFNPHIQGEVTILELLSGTCKIRSNELEKSTNKGNK